MTVMMMMRKSEAKELTAHVVVVLGQADTGDAVEIMLVHVDIGLIGAGGMIVPANVVNIGTVVGRVVVNHGVGLDIGFGVKYKINMYK
jgi:hypothetical protein